MKLFQKWLCAAASLLLALSPLSQFNTASAATEGAPNSQSWSCLGTTATLQVFDPVASAEDVQKRTRFFAEADVILKGMQNSLSSTVQTSSVYRFNAAAAGDRVEVDKTFHTVLSMALDLNAFTNGYYNPGVSYTVDLYGFSPRFLSIFPGFPGDSAVTESYDRVMQSSDGTQYATAGVLPDEKYVKAFQQLGSHFSEIVLEEVDGKYYATKPQSAQVQVEGDSKVYTMQIELGGIAKGYVTDLMNDLYDSYGYRFGTFDFGASSVAIRQFSGDSTGQYNLAFINPRDPSRAQYVKLGVKDIMLSTSGDYENFFEIEDTRYCHIINPLTGRPINVQQDGSMSPQAVSTVTLLGGSAASDDALTTALMCMGYEKAVEFYNQNKSSDYFKDCSLIMTSPNKDKNVFVLTDLAPKSYQLNNATLITSVQNGALVIEADKMKPPVSNLLIAGIVTGVLVVGGVAGYFIYQTVQRKKNVA